MNFNQYECGDENELLKKRALDRGDPFNTMDFKLAGRTAIFEEVLLEGGNVPAERMDDSDADDDEPDQKVAGSE